MPLKTQKEYDTNGNGITIKPPAKKQEEKPNGAFITPRKENVKQNGDLQA